MGPKLTIALVRLLEVHPGRELLSFHQLLAVPVGNLLVQDRPVLTHPTRRVREAVEEPKETRGAN